MRTQLVTLAATLTLVAFATTAAAAMAGSSSGGGSSGGGGSFGGGSSGGGSSSSGGGSGGSSGGSSGGRSGGSSGGGSAHGGSSGGGGGGGGGHAAYGNSRSGEFAGHSGFSGYGSVSAQSRDIAHGGYRVLDTRPATVLASTATPMRGTHTSLELGPKLGSAATAMRMDDDKRRVLPVPRPGKSMPVHHVFSSSQSTCVQNTCDHYRIDEMCPHWLIGDGTRAVWTTPLYCGQPVAVKLKPTSVR